MNERESDDVLTQLSEPPRPEFANDLYANLARGRRVPMTAHMNVTAMKRLAMSAIAVSLMVALMLTVSPGVRAHTEQTFRNVGGFVFDQRDHGWDSGHQANKLGGGNANSIAAPRHVSLAEAHKNVPYTFAVPAWTPSGFALTDTQVVNGNSLILQYGNGNRPGFVLRTFSKDGGTNVVGNDSVDEVKINGQPAALIRGLWDGSTGNWKPDANLLTLRWSQGDVTYEMYVNTNVGVSQDDMVRIAESMR
jgi:hypothetical protein